MAEDFNNAYEGLKTLEPDGKAPETRMDSALDASARIMVLLRSERQGRTSRRALVKGLVDGNPPFAKGAMLKAGRANACNVNWRVAEYYLNHARSAFYDIFSESPTYATVRTALGNSNQQETWSNIITEEYDRLLREDKGWDYCMQISQYEMILYGCGPIVFEDEEDWRSVAVLCRDVVVPDFTASDTTQWEEAVVLKDYSPHQLYNFIRKEEIASQLGWNIKATQKAIMEAHPKLQEGGQYRTWEWHQQQLKNQSYNYTSQSKIISCAHYLFREFPLPGEEEGKITHCIIPSPEDQQFTQQNEYLFRHIGRFKNWDEYIHPMYYDNDGGGYHHSVTGLGVKMYSAMEYQNRLLCNLADKVFAPKVIFRPTTANASEQLNIVQWGDYGKVPPGFEVMQTPVGSFIDDGMVFNRELTGLLGSNLSQYNPSQRKSNGNPITATQAQIDASDQARLGKTQLNHYYGQMDRLLKQKFYRAACPKMNGFKPGGRAALAFQKRCFDRGVPREALQKLESVIATRIIGQGSQFLRQQALQTMMGSVALWPSESGRNNLLSDFIASLAGQGLVERYNPSIDSSPEIDDQKAFAALQISAAKDTIPPVVTATQNHMVFAEAFLVAAAQAAASLQQGASPAEVYSFIDTLGPAIAKHLAYLSQDPSRRQQYDLMQGEWQKLAQLHDKLKGVLQQQAQQQQEQAAAAQRTQAIQQNIDPEVQLKQTELAAKLRMQQQKTDASIAMKREKQDASSQMASQQHVQDLTLADAKTASDITRQNAVATAKVAQNANTKGE